MQLLYLLVQVAKSLYAPFVMLNRFAQDADKHHTTTTQLAMLFSL
jgi:hypothetical protein